MRLLPLALIAFSVSTLTSAETPPSREAEHTAIATPDFPYAGFWKSNDCTASYGIAIAPAGKKGFYSVSFCGPGGCFTPGTYRPNTRIVGDDKYFVIDLNNIDVRGCGELSYSYTRFVRCPGREPF